MNDKKKDTLADIEKLEIAALDDQEPASIAAGTFTDGNTTTMSSCVCCSATATRMSE